MDFIRDMFKQVISILFSLGLIGILAFFFKEYIRRYVDHIFKEREAELEYDRSANLEMLKSFVPVFREIIELVYRLRNYARSILDQQTPVTPSRDLYIDSCNIFTERLYKYRALLDSDTFERLHEFKRINQDFLLILNVSDRDDQLRANEGRFSSEAMLQMDALFSRIESLYKLITEELQEKLLGKSHRMESID